MAMLQDFARIVSGKPVRLNLVNDITGSYNFHECIISIPKFQPPEQQQWTIIHESAHARFTPAIQYCDSKRLPFFPHIRVIEDVRVNNLILAMFPGFKPLFNHSTHDFHGECFLSRLNALSKGCGVTQLTKSEKILADSINYIKTFPQVIEFAREISTTQSL